MKHVTEFESNNGEENSVCDLHENTQENSTSSNEDDQSQDWALHRLYTKS